MKYLILFILFSFNAYASQVTTPTVWNNGDTVTASKLNGNQNAITNVVNGNLDNTNMASGYRLFQVVATLPVPGNQGAVAFQTSDNTLNLDNGSAWLSTVTPSGALAIGQIPYYNTGWQLLAPGTADYSIVSNGVSSLPSYRQVPMATGVSGVLSSTNGGTGANLGSSVQGTVPYFSATGVQSSLATGTSGQVLTTQGVSANPIWSTIDPGFSFVSATTFTTVSSTGDIPITNGQFYFARVVVSNAVSSAAYWLRINNDTTATNYLYVTRGFTFTAGSNNGNSTGAAQIVMDASSSPDSETFNIYLFPGIGSGGMSYVYGKGFPTSSSSSGYEDFSGEWKGSTPTSFRVLHADSANITGTVYLYKYSIS